MKIDVTKSVTVGANDGESAPITKCVCGELFAEWEEILGIYEESPWTCPKCGAKLIFEYSTRVFQLE